MTNAIPKVTIGSIGGSGTWGARFPEDFPDSEVSVLSHYEGFDTPWGMSAPFKLLGMCGQPVLRVAMHGSYPNDHEQIPPWISAKQVAWVFKQSGAKYVLTDGSVGGIQHPTSKRPLPPWSVVIPSDFIMDWVPPLESHNGRRSREGNGTFYRVAEPFCAALSTILCKHALTEPNFVSVTTGGTYACTQWGRFETAAEIYRLRRNGADIVGQTVGHEAVEARKQGLHLASLNIVSNYAEGHTEWIGSQPDDMARFYSDCPQPVGKTLIAALKTIAVHGVGSCHCCDYSLTDLNFPVPGA